jgi:hypothetical protein
MEVADVLKASIKVCMFDQYGTIVDMQTGLTEIARPYLESKGWKGNPNSFVTWWTISTDVGPSQRHQMDRIKCQLPSPG